MRFRLPSGYELLFCLLVWISVLLGAVGSYETKRVPATDPAFARHARISIYFTNAAIAVLLVAIAAMLGGRRKVNQLKRRARLGLCLRCGYDLRATPSHCPECGTIRHPGPNEIAKVGAGEENGSDE